jgi:hypothetical protein
VVVRRDEVVTIAPVDASGAGSLAERLRKPRRSSRAGLRVAIGLSTVQAGLAAVPEAYREASRAR